MRQGTDPAAAFGPLARAVRDAPVPAEAKERLFGAVEALAAAYGTADFSVRYGELAHLVEQDAPARKALQRHLRDLAASLH